MEEISQTDKLFLGSYMQTFYGTPRETGLVMDNCVMCITQLISRERTIPLQPGFPLTIYGYFDTLKTEIDVEYLNKLFKSYGSPFSVEDYTLLQNCIKNVKFPPPPKNNSYTTQYTINVARPGDVEWINCNGRVLDFYRDGEHVINDIILIDSVQPCQSKCKGVPATIDKIENTGQKTSCEKTPILK
jgi:hypothetical protein